MIEKIGNFLFHYRNGLFPAAVILLLLDTQRLLDNYWLAVIIGFIVVLSGQLLRALTIGLAYIIRGGKDRRVYAENLVTEGMFAHCRNPLYVGNMLIVAGISLIADSPLMVLIGTPAFVFAYYAITKAEEQFLLQKFGQKYQTYCARVPRFFLRFSGLMTTLRGMTFHWKRLVVKEYGTTFTWMTATILLILRNDYLLTGHRNMSLFLPFGFLLLILIVAYSVARILKKRKILRAD